MVKNLPAMQETQVQSLGREDLLEKGMATHSSILNEKTCLICMGVVQGSSYKSFKEIKDSDVLFCHFFLDFSLLFVSVNQNYCGRILTKNSFPLGDCLISLSLETSVLKRMPQLGYLIKKYNDKENFIFLLTSKPSFIFREKFKIIILADISFCVFFFNNMSSFRQSLCSV